MRADALESYKQIAETAEMKHKRNWAVFQSGKWKLVGMEQY